jgi:RNA polymerase sigma factor (sigma-70 family)
LRVGSFWLTTLTAIRRGDPSWRAIAAYETPVRRFLARRYPQLAQAERDDLVQEVLVAMRERIVPGYDAEVGSFRGYLCQAISNRVRDHYRRQRPTAQLEPELIEEATLEVGPDDALVLDLEARIVRGVQLVHDRYAQGSGADLELVYTLSGVLVDGLSNKEIAAREGLSPDQVKRKLQRARSEVLGSVFGELLGEGAAPAEVERAADLARSCLRQPRKAARLLEAEASTPVRDAAESFLDGLRHTRALSSGGDDSLDLVRGIEAIFAA